MGQGGQVRGHQARVIRRLNIPSFPFRESRRARRIALTMRPAICRSPQGQRAGTKGGGAGGRRQLSWRTTHSITSSAMASRFGGMERPNFLAVLRLITSSSLVGCSTGRSAGFAPLRILST
jgi:hypothetical protein